jgi:hypothetical protein
MREPDKMKGSSRRSQDGRRRAPCGELVWKPPFWTLTEQSGCRSPKTAAPRGDQRRKPSPWQPKSTETSAFGGLQSEKEDVNTTKFHTSFMNIQFRSLTWQAREKMPNARLEQTVQRFFEAFNRRDLDAKA